MLAGSLASHTIHSGKHETVSNKMKSKERLWSLFSDYTHTMARMCLHSHTQRILFKSESLSITKSHRLCGHFSDIKLATSQHMRSLFLCFMKVVLDAWSLCFGSVDLC